MPTQLILVPKSTVANGDKPLGKINVRPAAQISTIRSTKCICFNRSSFSRTFLSLTVGNVLIIRYLTLELNDATLFARPANNFIVGDI